MVERQIADGLISEDVKDKIVFVLLRKHRHQTKKPIHRSLADIGKSSSSSAAASKRAQRMPCSHTYTLRMYHACSTPLPLCA